MDTDTLLSLLAVVRRKNKIDQQSQWSDGSSTYLAEIRNELNEVEEELQLERQCYLEDELADVLWDYMNTLVCLESEKGINIERVFKRSLRKFEQRVSALESGVTWDAIKKIQKQALELELKGSAPDFQDPV